MKPLLYDNFEVCISQAAHWLQYRSKIVHTQRWQGTDIKDMPEMATHEVANCSFGVRMAPYDRMLVGLAGSHANMQQDINPNLPWAEDHFEERVCGAPINPGKQWAKWPYGNSASKFLDENGQFNNNYMERYWPKRAGVHFMSSPTEDADDWEERINIAGRANVSPHRGLRYEYGDLNDVVNLLATDPLTRQAYLPIWFPEDTGGGSKRAPCTIGYHFLIRDGQLNINYHIRSCDFLRHFRDDLYLTLRLAQWVTDRLAGISEEFRDLRLGNFYMQIGSLHLFRNDYRKLFGG